MPRMRILTASEREAFDKPPMFGHRERKQILNPPKHLMDTAVTFRTNSSRIGFLLMCGYFKATKRFYLPQDFHERDIAFIAHQLNLNDETFKPNEYSETTRLRHQKHILEFYGYTPFDEKSETALHAEIATMSRLHLRPRLMFDRRVDFLVQRRALAPKAGALLELIRSGLHVRKAELVTMMDAHLTDEARVLLDALFSSPDDQNRYRLTLLKKLSQSTKPRQIKECIADFETLAALYSQLEAILLVA